MVHCLITDKENYCALRPQSYELHTVEGVFFIPYCISFLLRLIENFASKSYEGRYDGQRFLFAVYGNFVPIVWVLSLPIVWGGGTTDGGFYSQFMLLSLSIV